ncbi:MAG: PKD domain-containing protein [Chitinophagaceae bacterium]
MRLIPLFILLVISNVCRGQLNIPCNNWLTVPSYPSYVNVGDLDVPGNIITVEAIINRTQPYLPGTGDNTEGDVVSKHTGPTDINYLLRPNHAYITTTNGFFGTPDICDLKLNKIYHVAMVYDGTTLKFFRNGFLMSQVAATGNLFQNNLNTRIGIYDGLPWMTQFIGFVNEVRIWNIARTQAQIRTYMNSSLPNPTTQTGLLAYYTFDNLLNKQGNPAWNGTLGGTASINTTTSTCTFFADSCYIPTPISNIINDYTPVLALDPCNNKITVENATAFNVGDTVLMIQMKGAVIDSTNTALFGTITNYKNAGNYEFNYVKSKTGNIIELKNKLLRSYDIPTGKVQLVRVPYYQNAVITAPLTCLAWDGNKGGVLVLNAADSVVLNANIDVSGKGFRGGNDPVTNPGSYFCYENQFFYPVNPDLASEKGEGIALVSASKSYGKGALANGGGGGNSHNSGGGGGSNSNSGGLGGYNFEGSPCDGTVPFDNRGIGGKTLTYNNATNKVFLGGGGGAGHTNNPEAFQAKGGNGGAIIIIIADKIKTNGNSILSNGNDGAVCGNTGGACHEGMGGGGAAGSVLLNINNYINNTSISARGGKGADMTSAGNLKVGPGGGGGGGVVWLKSASLPATVVYSGTGGARGVCTGYANDPWGTTNGGDGLSLFSLQIPFTSIAFKPNIDSVRINNTITGCNAADFFGLGYTNTSPISIWQWYFGDGGTANTQNTSHVYPAPGTYPVKLVVTDINGCKDSVIKNITVICNNDPIGNIINDYTPILALNPCDNKITVEDAGAFNVGDTVMMIQMKGAVIDSTNTSAFGTITNYKGAGNYEFNYVKSKAGNIIELKNNILRQYDIPAGKVQLIRVPFYQNVNITATLTCLPWDGSKGGVLVLNVQDTINMSTNIDVSGKGFRGGIGFNSQNGTLNCAQNNFHYPLSSNAAAGQKGESIASISDNIICGKGSPASGGGGGLGHNSGGGGGSNAGTGGSGGYQLDACGNAPFDNRGIGGHVLAYSTATNKIFMGGGGGAGQADNPGNLPSSGGNGAGIVILLSNYLKTNTNKIIANGGNGTGCSIPPSVDCHDGMGGGGAAGTILLRVNQVLDNSSVENKGGKGADMIGSVALGGRIGPGGGGSGGLLFLKSPALPANIINSNTGGANGVLVQDANNAWGASSGQNGSVLFNLAVPITTTLFKPNIDSVRINKNATACKSFNFLGLGYTNSFPVGSWQWYFGDGNTANTQNTSHSYLTAGTYTVKLVITDINGCKDSTAITLTLADIVVTATNSPTICESTQVQLNASGALTYSWSPATGLSNPNIPNPVATPPGIGVFRYIVTGTTVNNCSGMDTVDITINPKPAIIKSNNDTICLNNSAQLFASGGVVYSWLPSGSLNNPTAPNPIATPLNNTRYYVTVTGANTCKNTDSIDITVRSANSFSIDPPLSICRNTSGQLNASGGDLYLWSPAGSLNNATIANPLASPQNSTPYSVFITDTLCGNSATLSTTVNVLQLPTVKASKSNDLDCTVRQSQLNASGAVFYNWLPAATLNNPGLPNPIASPLVTTKYIVKGTDSQGCINYDSVMVDVSGANNGSYMMATGFTPDNNGRNDCYGIKFWGQILELEFSIYNRWGERIFFTRNPADCWNGIYKGVPQDPAVFVYMIKAKTACDPYVFRKGTFVLIR